MRIMIMMLLAALTLSGCAGFSGWEGQQGLDAGLLGTWERLEEEAPQYRHIKMLSPGHFVWVSYDLTTGRVVSMGGGTFEFDGRVYIERLEFASDNLPAEIIGEDQFFTAKLKGDEWRHEGTLSNGFQVREVWTRAD